MKNSRGESAEDLLEVIFPHSRKLFLKFQDKFFVITLHAIIFLENFVLSFS